MILHTENWLRLVPEAFDGLVVEVDAIHENAGGQRLRLDGKAMILRRDFHATGREVLDRLIGAAMAEFQLERFAPERLPKNLVAEANAENRNSRFDQITDRAHGVAQRRRVAGPV